MARFNYRIDEPRPDSSRWQLWLRQRPEAPYLLPFFAFVLVMMPGSFGGVGGINWEKMWRDAAPIVYPVKTILAALLLWYFWPWYTRISWRKIPLGIACGLFGTVLWVGSAWFCQWLGISQKPLDAALYSPDVLGGGWKELAFLCMRVAGPSLVVPVMEELFFRDFLMRALVRGGQFEEVPVGTFTLTSLLLMCGLFGINHGLNFFVPGVLYGLLMGILVIRTRSLGACIVAHGVTNWTLYLYVIYTGDWQFM